MLTGIIYKAMSGFYYIKSAGEIIMCTARGRFRHENSTPLVGDRVVFEATEQDKGVITDILPRKNAFVRPPLANVDVMVIVVSKAPPSTDSYLIDKMTVIALASKCNPVICINKLDINEADDLYDLYKTTGFPVIRTSAVNGIGLDELIAHVASSAVHSRHSFTDDCNAGLDAVICALCGNSGVGKSSILNAIDSGFGISTGEVSRKLGRGRHTTRHIELYELSGGTMLADTPGFSSYETGFITEKEDVQYLFPEFKPFLGSCRFDDCAHISEPGCAILEAVDSSQIHESRHESYKRLYRQAADHKAWEE